MYLLSTKHIIIVCYMLLLIEYLYIYISIEYVVNIVIRLHYKSYIYVYI